MKPLPLVQIVADDALEGGRLLARYLGHNTDEVYPLGDGAVAVGPLRLYRRQLEGVWFWVLGHSETSFAVYSSAQGDLCVEAVLMAASPAFAELWGDAVGCVSAALISQGREQELASMLAVVRPQAEKLVWVMVRGGRPTVAGIVEGWRPRREAFVTLTVAEVGLTDAELRGLVRKEAGLAKYALCHEVRVYDRPARA